MGLFQFGLSGRVKEVTRHTLGFFNVWAFGKTKKVVTLTRWLYGRVPL